METHNCFLERGNISYYTIVSGGKPYQQLIITFEGFYYNINDYFLFSKKLSDING